MKYKLVNALSQFSFQGAVISDISYHHQTLEFQLDNVTIPEHNSLNRDIHAMRANSFLLTFDTMQIKKFILEGYKTYDADNRLTQQTDDEIVPPEEYYRTFETLLGTTLYSIETGDEGSCVISIDGEYQTYLLELDFKLCISQWDRFLKKE